jgi:zinc-ribbon domain
MSFCTRCGRPRTDAARFCTTCGTPFRTAANDAPDLPAGAPPDLPTAVQAVPPAGVSPDPPMPVPPGRPGSGPGIPDDPFAGLFRNTPGEPGQRQRPLGPPYDRDPLPAESDPPPSALPGGPHRVPPRRNRAKAAVIVAAVIVVLAAGGAGAWAALAHKGHPDARPITRERVTPITPSTSAQPSIGTPSPSATPTTGSGLVALGPGVPQSGPEPTVAAFLNSYFAAINDDDYQQYRSLLGTRLRQELSAAQFSSGYRSVHDSHVTLTSIASAGGPGVAASMTFTSYQPPAKSASHSSCTHWSITLYLVPHGSSYVMGSPPAGYHAAYHAC